MKKHYLGKYHAQTLDLFNGEILESFELTKERECLVLYFRSGARGYARTQNDCCNVVWFEHVNEIAPVAGGTITGIEVKVDWHDIDEVKYQDEAEALQFEVVTTKGILALEVRNESNGYYGGNVYFQKWTPEPGTLAKLNRGRGYLT